METSFRACTRPFLRESGCATSRPASARRPGRACPGSPQSPRDRVEIGLGLIIFCYFDSKEPKLCQNKDSSVTGDWSV